MRSEEMTREQAIALAKRVKKIWERHPVLKNLCDKIHALGPVGESVNTVIFDVIGENIEEFEKIKL